MKEREQGHEVPIEKGDCVEVAEHRGQCECWATGGVVVDFDHCGNDGPCVIIRTDAGKVDCCPIDQLKLSKERFTTGAVRDQRSGKGRYDLISPVALAALAARCEFGAEHYGDRNWEKGIPVARILDSALRHLNQYRGGDRTEDHLGAALWNVHAAIHVIDQVQRGKLPAELNDLPNYQGEPTE